MRRLLFLIIVGTIGSTNLLESMDEPVPPKRPIKTYSFKREKLHYAVMRQNLDEVRRLLSEGAPADVRDSSGLTPLHYAVRNGYVEHVRALVAHDPMLQFIQSTRSTLIRNSKEKPVTPHEIAVEKNHPEIMQILRDAIDIYDRDGTLPLHRAVHKGDYEAVLTLLDTGASIDARTQDNFLETALHRAMRLGHCGIVQLLLERGADITAENRVGYTPLGEAEQNWSTNARICLQFGLPIRDDQAIVPSVEASNALDRSRISEILEHPVEQAAAQTNPDQLRHLLASPTDPVVQSRALSIAAGRHWMEGAEILLSARAEPFQAFTTVRGIIERLRHADTNDNGYAMIFELLKSLVDQWENFKQNPGTTSFFALLPSDLRSMVLTLLMNTWRTSL